MPPKQRTARSRSRQTRLFEDTPPGPAKAASKGRRTTGAAAKPKTSRKPTRSTPVTRAAKATAKRVPARKKKKSSRREDAQSMAARQREISVSEFFTKNRHLLGFDNPQKALLTAVKEAVDNSLDACEEAEILPDLRIEIAEAGEGRYRVTVQDNGPGIVRKQIPRIFGKLLYGSKFHRLKQQRGQQGIGISAAGMYAQLTTGKPVRIISRTGKRQPAHAFDIAIDTQKNAPVVQRDEVVEWENGHGTRVTMELEATYKKGRRSVDGYVEQTALANPHATIVYAPPKDEPRRFERVTEELPRESKEIKPHPYGVELGAMLRLFKETKARTAATALMSDFSRVSHAVAHQICDVAGVRPGASARRLSANQVELIFRAIPKVKIMAPPTACLSPIGDELLLDGLKARIEADFYTTVTRPPSVYRGNPFQIEVGVAYGGDLNGDALIELYRFANRVPLQYQQSACAITKSAISTDWKKYGLQQARGALPSGPAILSVHIASVWVPFTSESKEAVASYPEIVKEIRLALMEAGRRLGAFVRARRKAAEAARKHAYIDRYIPQIGEALQQILGLTDRKRDNTIATLRDILKKSRKM
jgi:DNA topoisomerase-6 subunit B